jgi:hypothetical protein
VGLPPLPAADAVLLVAGCMGRAVPTPDVMLGTVAFVLGVEAAGCICVAGAVAAVWEAVFWSDAGWLGSAPQAPIKRVVKASCDAVLFIPSAPMDARERAGSTCHLTPLAGQDTRC